MTKLIQYFLIPTKFSKTCDKLLKIQLKHKPIASENLETLTAGVPELLH